MKSKSKTANVKKKYLQLPVRFRAALYCAPLFISWIIGYSIETDVRSQRAAGRGLMLFAWFLAGRALLFVAHEVTKSFALYGYVPDLIFFALKSIMGLVYLGYGLFLAVSEVRDQSVDAAGLDRQAERLNSFLSR